MHVLVTGGAGFIGCNLVRTIIDRPEIDRLIVLDCLTYAGHLENLADVLHHKKFTFEQVDLRNKHAVYEVVRKHKITHVMHLAAESHVDRSITGPADFIHTNVIGTFNLLEACRVYWLEECLPQDVEQFRFLHVSTDEVYGSLGPTGYFTETTPYAPNSPYSASKAAADMLVRAYHHTYGLPTLITNCSNNFGPYQFPEKLIPVVIQAAIERRPIPVYGDGLNVRDWLYVLDHANALWLVLTCGRVGQTYNIGASNEWPNIKLVEKICDLVDELAPHLGGSTKSLITFVKDRPGHDRRYAIDASKIRTELGWTPAYPFDEALRYTVDWYIHNQDWVKKVLENAKVRLQKPGS